MSSGPNLECGHGQCDVRRDCMTCLQFTVQTLNDRHYKQGIELSNCEANLADAREALQWIAAQEDLTFAECSLAEKIIWRAKNWSTEGKCAVIITKEGDRCTREEGHEGAHELDLTSPAATQEQPAGSKRCGECEWHGCAGREHGCGCKCHVTEMIAGQAKLEGVERGSPRKVGEDGPDERFEAHTKAVADFLNELYAIMVDPCADEPVKVADMQKALLDAARRDREHAHFVSYYNVEATARLALERWRTKPHNAKWWKKIDGTPIPNDLIVCISEDIAKSLRPSSVPVGEQKQEEGV